MNVLSYASNGESGPSWEKLRSAELHRFARKLYLRKQIVVVPQLSMTSIVLPMLIII